MFKQLVNTLELRLTIEPDGPILIKSGQDAGIDPTLPDMNFVRSRNPHTGTDTVYLPGSSLKGVIRSHAERIARATGLTVCDPLGDDACGQKAVFRNSRTQASNGAEVYREMCPACKTFGHLVLASRFKASDAYPVNTDAMPVTSTTRQMVAIDRRSGGSINTFDMEVVTSGQFTTKIVMQNFERWQIGLLALVLRDLLNGRVGLGFGKSRGLGQVKGHYMSLQLIYAPGMRDHVINNIDVTGIYGLGELVSEDMVQAYEFAASQSLNPVADLPWAESNDWGQFELTLNAASANSNDTDLVHSTVENALRTQVAAWSRFAGMA